MTPPRPFDTSIAVVVGIDRYGDGIPALRTAANDARRVASILGTSHGYDVIQLIDEEATQERLAKLLKEELPARVKPGDRVFFYWAGHGVARDGDDGPNGYLLPFDARRGDEASFLHMPLVHDALLALECRHMLVVLDSCFSGAFRWSGTRAAELVDDDAVIHQERYDRFVRDAAWQVITSAAQDQKALDQLSTGALGSRDGEGAHSPFALALFEALDGAGDVIPRQGGDGLVTATELYLYLEERLQTAALEAGKRQTPRLWPLRKHDKGEFVFFVPGRDLTLPPAPPLTFDNNPWRGLASYDAADAPLFFGRDAEIVALRARIAATPLTVVLGASGTGKSSLVKAGVVPRLAADGWHVLPIVRPGTAPLDAIGTALDQSLAAAGVAASAAHTPDALAEAMQRLVDVHRGTKVALVIDQCEELVTLARSRAEREIIVAFLARLVEAHADVLRLVLTLRTDFEPNFDRAAFGERWRGGRYIVPPMSRENLRAVIEQPATRRVLYFDPTTLVETLLDEVVATPGALPLLSFALSEMYVRYVERRSSDRAITRDDYEALGGVVGALRARAEAEFAALDEAHRATLRRLLLRMVVAEGGTLARRRVADAELDFPDAGEHARAEEVVRRLTSARLLVEGKEADGEPFVEPAHDALVRGWGRLQEWVREEGEARFPLSQQQRLARAAAEWERADRAAQGGMVWSDAVRSAQLSALIKGGAAWLNRREREFARRSIRGRAIRRATATAAVVAIAAAGAWAFLNGRQASERAEQVRLGSIVRTAAALASEDPLTAGLVLGSLDSALVPRLDPAAHLALLRTAADLFARPHVSASFGAVGSGLAYARLSPDGQWVAMASREGVLKLWKGDGASDPLALDQGDEHSVWGLAFSPGSDRLVSAALGGALYVWTLGSRARPIRLAPPDSSRLHLMAFSADGRRIAAFYQRLVYDDVTHELEDFAPSREARVFNADGSGTPTILSLAPGEAPVEDFGLDRRWLVTLADSTVRLWPREGAARATHTLRMRALAPTTAMASPDGTRLAIAGASGRVEVVSLATGGTTLRLTEHADSVTALAWSADGQLLATFGRDATRIWNARTGRRVARLEREGEVLSDGVFSPDGTALLTRSLYGYDAILWGWDEAGRGYPTILSGHADLLTSVAFAPDGARPFTTSRDGTARLWELQRRLSHLPLQRLDTTASGPDDLALSAAAFSPSGRLLAFATSSGAVGVAPVDSLGAARLVRRSASTLRALVFRDDDRTMSTISVDGVRADWTLDGNVAFEVPAPDDLMLLDAVVGADQRHVIAFSSPNAVEADTSALDLPADSGLYLWHLERREAPVKLEDPDGTILAAALSHDGQWLATGNDEGIVYVRRLDPPGGRVVVVQSEKVNTIPLFPTSLAFAPDGMQLAVAWEDGTVSLHPIGGGARGEARTARTLTAHTRAVTALEFSGDGRRLLTQSSDGTVRVWDATSGRAIVALRPRGMGTPTAHFTRDGARVLTVPAADTVVNLWNADGSGGVATFAAAGSTIRLATMSADGRWLLIALDNGGAELWPLDVNVIRQTFARGPICLSANDRQRYLSERPTDADARFAACERSHGRSASPSP